jgi:hypothetical protein
MIPSYGEMAEWLKAHAWKAFDPTMIPPAKSAN